MLFKELQQFYAVDIADGFIPVIFTPLKAPEKDPYSWHDFYRRLLSTLNEPYDENSKKKGNAKAKTADDDPSPATTSVKKEAKSNPWDRIDDLRMRIEEDATRRHVKVLILDEVQHLVDEDDKSPSVEKQLNILKSFGNMGAFHTVLLGTYQVMKEIELNEELSRRVNFCHFPRYDAKAKKDAGEFKSVLNTFKWKLLCFNPQFDLTDKVVADNLYMSLSSKTESN
jgi:hypothetical protein